MTTTTLDTPSLAADTHEIGGTTVSMAPATFDTMRHAMVASQLRTNAVTDTRVLDAMGRVARERFVPPARAAIAYADVAVPLGEVFAGPASQLFGTRPTLLVCAAVIVVATTAAVSTPSVRALTTEEARRTT